MKVLRFCRHYSVTNKLRKKVTIKDVLTIQPSTPARTRFAPSPTGYLHLGSLRTALYNYLLAKNTGGQFLLRLEDTDRTRLVDDAEKNIYDTLKWCGMKIDEGPPVGGPYAPYRQSDRMHIYKKYALELIEKGLAYKCTCSKERLNNLRESAMELKPPTTVTYDRRCASTISDEGESIGVIRFKSPDVYPPFKDLLHGLLNLQPQYNHNDRRYDDFIIMKSDGLPTYHFANVVDDHLMKITHVIRGEEWLPSTPKHISLYHAFGWSPPEFIHIPLLTSLGDKKLSKRQGDLNILSLKDKGVLPEALINFVALFGWSAPRDTPGKSVNEILSMQQLIDQFSLDNLTKGNAKVNDSKLYFFNKHHLNEVIKYPEKLAHLVDDYFPRFTLFISTKSLDITAFDRNYLVKLITLLGPSLTSINDIEDVHSYIFDEIEYNKIKKIPQNGAAILESYQSNHLDSLDSTVESIMADLPEVDKKSIFQTLRFALSGGVPGLTIPLLIDIIGEGESNRRISAAKEWLLKV